MRFFRCFALRGFNSPEKTRLTTDALYYPAIRLWADGSLSHANLGVLLPRQTKRWSLDVSGPRLSAHSVNALSGVSSDSRASVAGCQGADIARLRVHFP